MNQAGDTAENLTTLVRKPDRSTASAIRGRVCCPGRRVHVLVVRRRARRTLSNDSYGYAFIKIPFDTDGYARAGCKWELAIRSGVEGEGKDATRLKADEIRDDQASE